MARKVVEGQLIVLSSKEIADLLETVIELKALIQFEIAQRNEKVKL